MGRVLNDSADHTVQIKRAKLVNCSQVQPAKAVGFRCWQARAVMRVETAADTGVQPTAQSTKAATKQLKVLLRQVAMPAQIN